MRDLASFIITIKNAVPDELCAAILGEYAGSDEWTTPTMSGVYAPHVRNCTTIDMSTEPVIARNNVVRAALDRDLFNAVRRIGEEYLKRFPKATFNGDSGYALLRYEPGQYIRSHVDFHAQQQRIVSCSLQLNSSAEFTGGDWKFFEEYPLYMTQEKGDAIMFPANFCYPHEINPVLSGTRYSIITWLTLA